MIYNFTGLPDGAGPYGGVIRDAAGNLYGTTTAGGYSGCSEGVDGGCGTIFQLTPSGSGWAERILYYFQNGNSGNSPEASLIMDGVGNLYGTTLNGGQHGGGTAFELTPYGGLWNFSVAYPFTSCCTYSGPYGPLVMDNAGNLYGTINGGGNWGYGAVFKLTSSNGGWTYSLLYSFTNKDDGKWPSGNLVLDSAGNIYGTASFGGALQWGLVWELSSQ